MNDLPPADPHATAPVHACLDGAPDAGALAGAREWLLHAHATHPGAPVVLTLGDTPAHDAAAVQLLAETAHALRRHAAADVPEGDLGR